MSVLSEEIRQKIRDHFGRYPNKQAVTLPALHMVQKELKCVPREAVEEIAELLELSPAQVYDTLSFYGFFRDQEKPVARNAFGSAAVFHACFAVVMNFWRKCATDCTSRLVNTTSDGELTIELAECLGACDGAPCMLIEDELQLGSGWKTFWRWRRSVHE